MSDVRHRDLFRSARSTLSPAMVLAQKLNSGGAFEKSADGAEVTLSDGRVLVDFGSYAVTLLGHRHRAVVAAVERCLSTMPTSTRVLPNAYPIELARALAELVSSPTLTRVCFAVSGADAVEIALKLARVQTGRTRVLAVEGAFHGKSLGALGVTWSPRYKPPPLGDGAAPVTFLSPDDPFAALRAGLDDVAAIIFEPVQGESGAHPIAHAVLEQWCSDARRHGAFVIADEVQCGFYRCGHASRAVADGLTPDAVLLGKALGGGIMPLAAALVTEEMYRPLRDEPFLHSSTFSAHPLSCAAGLGAIEAVEQELPRLEAVAGAVEAMLQDLHSEFSDVIVAVHGCGLLWGIELASPALAGEVLLDLASSGLVISPCLGRPEVLRLLPPLVATDHHLKLATTALHRAVRAASATTSVRNPGGTRCQPLTST